MDENVTGTVYSAAASDPDGDPVTYAVAGPDGELFTIDADTGALAFAAAPDFETPADADGDNIYTLSLSATDPAGASDTQTVNITVEDTDESAERYIDEVFASVTAQRRIGFAPGLRLDLFTPAGDTVTNRPVMIVASGGGFIAQDRRNVEPIAEAFARRGYVAVTMDYRVLGGDPDNADDLAIAAIQAAHDMFAAVRFLRADSQSGNTFGIRADAVFVSGESAGGVMSAVAATLDPTDTISSDALRTYIEANGGAFGNVGSNTATSSAVQGAMPLSGAILDLATIDAGSAVMFAAHEEFDPVVPCETAAEGSSGTGLVVSGGCAIVDAYTAIGASAELFLVQGSDGHVEFTDAQREAIYAGAAQRFFDTVISQ